MVARGMLKPVYFAFVKTMLEFFLQTTHFVKSQAHSPRPTSKIIAINDSLETHHFDSLFSSCSCKKYPYSGGSLRAGHRAN